ncbi:hypothetical protein COU18_02600 [Candidatus Kaiserbacteria bacterium CG10_big_fil_rev_8_21_14_0_10_51_14]|uniref:Uncharacterized protein n=1 Tax=Candidatus Kaiserbacteria bacterium CG10_big_fil_rev_8_21_14_0_10_51_14 TaxID=1974610 RepID=A0A2H0UB36_9BACT|nr:MAG: hypothetical protein COU18_02600 [Candidatus Kaiserbacteria bacterium CG10_big_fil_rev_8_21_14_0_10_51_14]
MSRGIWREPPLLTKEGQVAFWNGQKDYANTGMSNDSQGELDIVLEKSRRVHCRDIVTLGGAVGCRDPKMILEDMRARGHSELPKIIFNDLAEELVQRARQEFLKPFVEDGADVTFIPGAISDIAAQIPAAPRRLLLGIYRSDAFFTADPDREYPMSGYNEYLENHARLGEEFFMHWVSLTEENLLGRIGNDHRSIRSDDTELVKLAHKRKLEETYRTMTRAGVQIAALQIIGTTEGRDGHFSSHWYTEGGILKMVRQVFTPDRFTIDLSSCAKSMVLTVDSIRYKPTGIVTVINNVLGNVIPDSQYETLVAIRRMLS